MARISLLLVLMAALSVSGCKNDNKPAKTETATAPAVAPTPKPAPKSDLTDGQTGSLINMLSAYYGLKDALVASNSTKADEAAAQLLSTAELLNNDLGSQPQFNEIHPQLKNIMAGCEAITGQKNQDIEQDRQHFAAVSDAMFKVLKAANLKHGGVYQEFCPMAMNDKGAYWLSAESEIKNPYYGKKMLECGEVRDSL